MKTISLKLPDGLNAKLNRVAKERDLSKSEVVREALEQFFNGHATARTPLSALDLARDLAGCLEGPGELSTNPKYMEGFGK
jgi:Arc/MetJ-type ribon-helix-helix transcriptional regulator